MTLGHTFGHHAAAGRDRPWLQRTVEPQSALALPATVAEFTEYLEDPCPPDAGSTREALLQQMLATAAEAVVSFTDREFITRTVVTSFDAYAHGRVPQGGLLPMALPEPVWLTLPRVPAVDGTVSVELVDEDGATTALSSDDYDIDTVSVPHRFHLNHHTLSTDLAHFRGLRVTYDAGYGTDPSAVPMALKMGVLMYAAYLYERRGGEASMPMRASGAEAVLGNWRVLTGL